MDLQSLKDSWWVTLTETEKAQYRDFPAYIRMRNYVESGGKEEALQNCTFRYIVQAIKGTLNQNDAPRLDVALRDWKIMKLDGYLLGLYHDTKDTVMMAKDLINFHVLDEEFDQD